MVRQRSRPSRAWILSARDVLPDPVPPAIPISTGMPGDYTARVPMAALRALGYFVEEAVVSLWRSRVMNALSVATITVSLFVLGAFLTLASNLGTVVDRWSQKAQVSFFLEDG